MSDQYASLRKVFDEAFKQAAEGKGKERHATGEPFEQQVICEVTRRVGMGYPLGQAIKKCVESQRLGVERAIVELLGAINYLAAAVIIHQEKISSDRADQRTLEEIAEIKRTTNWEWRKEFK